MRKFALFAFLGMAPLSVIAQVLPCDALRSKVDAKLQAKGVQSYTLAIVPAAELTDELNAASAVPSTITNNGKVIGSCEAGSKRLIYIRGN
jgi:hypothetical protein